MPTAADPPPDGDVPPNQPPDDIPPDQPPDDDHDDSDFIGALFRLRRGFFRFIIATAVSVHARWKKGQGAAKGGNHNTKTTTPKPQNPPHQNKTQNTTKSIISDAPRLAYSDPLVFRLFRLFSIYRSGNMEMPRICPHRKPINPPRWST